MKVITFARTNALVLALILLNYFGTRVVHANCTGNRFSCNTVGDNDALMCAEYVYEGCEWISTAVDTQNPQTHGVCNGTPPPCDTFTTVEACQVHRNCQWNGTVPSIPAVHAPVAAVDGVVQATATATLDYYDFNPWTNQMYHDRTVKSQPYALKISFDDPVTTGGGTESNPFSMYMIDGSGSASANFLEGLIAFSSAHSVTTPHTGRDLLLQYWEYTFDSQTGALQGTLVNNHLAEGASANWIYAWEDLTAGYGMVIMSSMANGCTIEGTIGPTSLSFVISGENANTYVKFQTEIQATFPDGSLKFSTDTENMFPSTPTSTISTTPTSTVPQTTLACDMAAFDQYCKNSHGTSASAACMVTDSTTTPATTPQAGSTCNMAAFNQYCQNSHGNRASAACLVM